MDLRNNNKLLWSCNVPFNEFEKNKTIYNLDAISSSNLFIIGTSYGTFEISFNLNTNSFSKQIVYNCIY